MSQNHYQENQNQKICPSDELEVTVKLIKAEMSDFTHYENGEQGTVRNVGMMYWLLNTEGKMEPYRLSPTTDTRIILQWIKAGKCYVFKSLSI